MSQTLPANDVFSGIEGRGIEIGLDPNRNNSFRISARMGESVACHRILPSKIGIYDSAAMRQDLAEHLAQVLNDSSNIVSRGAGTEVRESLLMGPGGAVKLETVWQGDKLITAVVKEGVR